MEKWRFQGWGKFVLMDVQLFLCKDKPETSFHVRKQKISKDVYSLHRRQKSWEETYSILNGRGQFHKGLRKLTAIYRPLWQNENS